jgi:hypothetical protein
MGILLTGLAEAQPPMTPPPGASPRREAPQYVPLQQVVPRASEESGVEIEADGPLLNELVPAQETGPDQSLDLEPVLDGFSRIELFGDDSELQKVIIMDRIESESSQSPTSASTTRSAPVAAPSIPRSIKSPQKRTGASAPAPAANPAQEIEAPESNLDKEQLQELIRGPYRSPLPDKLWDDPAYRQFLTQRGFRTREDMKDRNKAKRLRSTVRRLLWKMRNNS